MNVELEEYKKLMLKVARRRAVVTGIFVVVILSSWVYMYIQNTSLKEQQRVKLSEVTALNIIIRQMQEDEVMSKRRLEKAVIDATIAREAAEACQKLVRK